MTLDDVKARMTLSSFYGSPEEFDLFEPIVNDEQILQFDDYDGLILWVKQNRPDWLEEIAYHAWTVVDVGDDTESGLEIQNGWHFCNRMFYILTENNWKLDDMDYSNVPFIQFEY